jgi:hypothetical protein
MLILVFLAMIIMIAAGYGNEFIAIGPDYKQKLMLIKGRVKGKY